MMEKGYSQRRACGLARIDPCYTATNRAVLTMMICAGIYVNWHPNDGGSGIGACTRC